MMCEHCFASANNGNENRDLPDSDFLLLFDRILRPEVRAVSFTGGEPLMRPGLVIEMLDRIKKTGITTTLNSNGWFLDNSLVTKLKEYELTQVQVSLDSSTPEKHDAFRKKNGSYRHVMDAIRNCSDNRLPIYARVTITSFNYNEMCSILQLVLENGGQGIIVKPLVPSGRGQNSENCPSRQQQTSAITSLVEAVKANPDASNEKVKFLTPSYPFLIDSQFVKYNDRCECGDKLAFISSSGNVQPCGYTHFVLGNLNERSLEDIWNNSPFLLNWRKKRLNGKCLSCGFSAQCNGGCRAAAYETSGSVDTVDPLCWRAEECP